jgi:hypothetical protein
VESAEAREHLEMVERIISASSRKLEAGGEFFVVWGIVSAGIELLAAAVSWGRLAQAALWWIAPLVLAGVAFSAWRASYLRRTRPRMSLLQREFLNVLWLTMWMAILAELIGFNLFSGWGTAAIWTVAEALVLLYIGTHGNRRAQIGGIVMLASLALANFMLAQAGYILAAGMVLGYAGFGVADLLARE